MIHPVDDELRRINGELKRRILRHLPVPGKQATAVKGLTLSRRQEINKADNCFGTPSVAAIVQGGKCALIGDREYPAVIAKLESAVTQLDAFMHSQGLTCAPEDVNNLKGDEARCQFINLFKEVKRLKTQLDQYTDLTPENAETIEKIIPADQLQGLQGVYLETAQRLKVQQEKKDGKANSADDAVQQLEFEFVLFSSAVIDYDYIMKLIAGYTQAVPGKQSMTRDELIGLIQADAKFVDERDDIAAYIKTLSPDKGMSEAAIREGYKQFKVEKNARELAEIAAKHGLEADSLQAFVDSVMQRMIFDGEQLGELLVPLGLGWKARTQKELALMEDLIPLLHKLAKGRDISGLGAYE